MSEEHADSGSVVDTGPEVDSSIDMDAAMDSISSDLFGVEPEKEPEDVKESSEEITEEASDEAKEEPEESKPATRPAPQSWKKEMHEFWNGLDPSVQAYVEQREQQMHDGLEKDRGDATLGRTMRDVMTPYSEMLKAQGIDEPVMVRNLMNAHYRLSTADEAGKRDLINQIAQSYNISLDGEAPKVDPALKAIQDKVNSLESHLTAAQQATLQEARDRVEQDVEVFASDPTHEFFDEVSEQIVPLINAGYSLEDAYQNAIWLNPVTRQKEMDRNAKDAAEKAEKTAKQEAEKARKAKSANVRGRDTGKASTEPKGTMEDTLLETYNEIQNRSH